MHFRWYAGMGFVARSPIRLLWARQPWAVSSSRPIHPWALTQVFKFSSEIERKRWSSITVQGAEGLSLIRTNVYWKGCCATVQVVWPADVMLFDRWSYTDVKVGDLQVRDYVIAGMDVCPVVERLTYLLMMHDHNNGKKLLADAMEIIYSLTDQNPIQVIYDALINSVPREDATCIGSAGALRRVNQAIYLLTTGARESALRNSKTIAECLADELINAAKGSSNSYAMKKKDEIERVAKANR